MEKENLIIGEKYRVICDNAFYKKGDVVTYTRDDYSQSPLFTKADNNTVYINCDNLEPYCKFKVGDLVKTTPELYKNYYCHNIISLNFDKSYEVDRVGEYIWQTGCEIPSVNLKGTCHGWIPQDCFVLASDIKDKPSETEFNVGDVVSVTNIGKTYTTHPKAQEYGCVNYVEGCVPEKLEQYTIKKLFIINISEKVAIITNGSQDWLIGLHGIEKVSSLPKIVMSDGIEPKGGMWIYNTITSKVFLLTGAVNKNGDYLFDTNLVIGNDVSAIIKNKSAYWRKATNLEVAQYVQKHDLWKHLEGELDFLVGLWISFNQEWMGVSPGNYEIKSVSPSSFNFGRPSFSSSSISETKKDVWSKLTFSDTDVSSKPIPPTSMYNIGDEVYDEEGNSFDSDVLLHITDTNYQNGWKYKCVMVNNQDLYEWIREEDLRSAKPMKKLEPVQSSESVLPEWVFPGVKFRDKKFPYSTRTITKIINSSLFESTMWNGKYENKDIKVNWLPTYWDDFEPIPYQEAQELWIKENDLKPGDSVKVMRKCKSQFLGWKDIWLKDDMEVGNIFEFVYNNQLSGIGLSDAFNYPYFCLEKIQPTTKEDPFKELKEAYARGEQIQFWWGSAERWEDITGTPLWGPSVKYRIKPYVEMDKEFKNPPYCDEKNYSNPIITIESLIEKKRSKIKTSNLKLEPTTTERYDLPLINKLKTKTK